MNWEHLRAFLWLRWRLMVNQWRRGGAVNAILMTILAVGLLITAVPLFAVCLVLGLFAFPKATPANLLYAWDGMTVGFVFFWSIGLMTELQRTETLSLSKFLHLPVSVNGAFIINFVSSLFCLSLILFAPAMFGFAVALAISKGALLLSVLPLTAAFFLMVTALTYQFQGWLASLMSNPRRRRTVVVMTTVVFVLILQLPSLLNAYGPWRLQRRAGDATKLVEEFAALDRAFQAHEFDSQEHVRRQQELMRKYELANDQTARERAQRLQQTARIVNTVVPLGWLPLGVMAAAEGNILPATLGFLGMALVGVVSLRRAYRTTVGMYQGQQTSRKGRAAPAVALPPKAGKRIARLLELRLPWLSEPTSAIALAGLRSLVRAPESKMMLLTPLLLGAVFGSMLLRSTAGSTPDLMRTLIAIGAIALALAGAAQLMANQFGFDRDGFRVFVLCGAPRREILLGKNLAFAPVTLGMVAVLLTIVQVVCPMRWDHVLAMLPQFISMFLLFCIVTNLCSIYAPMHIAAGSLKPATPRLIPVLLQLAVTICFFPLTQAPTLLPLGIEAVFEWQGWRAQVPICLLLSLAECALVVFVYRVALDWQSDLFQAQEQKILQAVTNRAS